VHPEIEYVVEHGKKLRAIDTVYIDIPFLSASNKENAKEYLIHLINAEKGDEKSRNYLLKKRTDYYKALKKIFTSNIFTDDKYVVPSITNKKCNAKLVSHKGATLIELTQEGFPVPDFCILTSENYSLPQKNKIKNIENAISNLEKLTFSKIGATENPLILAMRCAMPEYIPGLMPTYLNVGVTDKIYLQLKKTYGIEVANKIYYNNLKTIHAKLYPDFDCNTDDSANKSEQIDFEKMINYYFEKISIKDNNLLTDAYYQFEFFIGKAETFYKNNEDLIYTFQKGRKTHHSIILQKMVWTVRDEDSYPGVLYTSHSRTGLGMQIESVKNIFGEDIMTGLVNTEHTEFFNRDEIKVQFPAIYHFSVLSPLLEKKLKSPATIEFAAESFNGRHFFSILQLDNSELTGRATLLSAIHLYKRKIISKKRVVKLIHPYHLRQIFSERIDNESLKELKFFCHGISILPRSAVSAKAYFSANAAIEAKKKGEKVCFCKSTFSPSDRIVMSEVDAIISMTPAAIHVVTACLGYGIPALINLENYNIKLVNNSLVNEHGVAINEGDWITISSKHRILFLGKANYKPARFQKYLEGQKLELEPKEEKVFINMATAFGEYQKIVNSLDSGDITKLSDLVKLIRNDLQKNPGKAANIVNKWFDAHTNYYIHQILESELGTHTEQYKLYNFLTTDRKIKFFKNIIPVCRRKNLKGDKAGAFMLGRFMCQPHPIAFWKELTPNEIVFLLNEYVLFEKYLQILNDFGERHINRIRNEALNYDLGSINLSKKNAAIFISLKLYIKDWKEINAAFNASFDKETKILIDLLQVPYGSIYEFDSPWSYNELQEICGNERIPVPDKSEL
jgi:hypothetical protein